MFRSFHPGERRFAPAKSARRTRLRQTIRGCGVRVPGALAATPPPVRGCALSLRERGDSGGGRAEGATGTAHDEEQAARHGRAIRCAVCGNRITSPASRVEKAGSSQHTFVNPHGIVFRITCFAEAPGAIVAGPPSTHWTWFPGYSWRVLICRRCGTHLGWHFQSAEDRFSGLIDERLVETGYE